MYFLVFNHVADLVVMGTRLTQAVVQTRCKCHAISNVVCKRDDAYLFKPGYQLPLNVRLCCIASQFDL